MIRFHCQMMFYYMDKLIYLFINFIINCSIQCTLHIFRWILIMKSDCVSAFDIGISIFVYMCVLPNRFSIPAINCVGMYSAHILNELQPSFDTVSLVRYNHHWAKTLWEDIYVCEILQFSRRFSVEMQIYGPFFVVDSTIFKDEGNSNHYIVFKRSFLKWRSWINSKILSYCLSLIFVFIHWTNLFNLFCFFFSSMLKLKLWVFFFRCCWENGSIN